MADFDIAIIGGGINGAGIARDAAGRGLRVVLVEQGDLASGTSSASSKLIHGGLRYLEQGAFRLVREALAEREVLLRMAPHVVRPLRFVLPVHPDGRSALLLRLGLFIYDTLGGRGILPGADTLDLTHHPMGQPLKRPFGTAFEYSDCWVDDSRLVVLNALDAAARGASIRPGTRCVRADRDEIWRLSVLSRGRRESLTARVLVNAAGPWINQVHETVLRVKAPQARLVKGSHIIVPKLFAHDQAYILQNADGRVVFALPFTPDFTLVGTTDLDFSGDLATLSPGAEEIAYLCAAANAYFRESIQPADVVHAFCGVRALCDTATGDPKDASRDYWLRLDAPFREAPLLTVYGGKITTYRRLAQAALDRLGVYFKASGAWTDAAPLPGGDFPHDGLAGLIEATRHRWPFLATAQAERLVRAYGTRVGRVLGTAATAQELGAVFTADLSATEVRYLMAEEWARTAEDVLWRRSRLGLSASRAEIAALETFMAAETSIGSAPF